MNMVYSGICHMPKANEDIDFEQLLFHQYLSLSNYLVYEGHIIQFHNTCFCHRLQNFDYV